MWNRALLRPPGAVPERNFLARCIHCGQCVEVCPHDSLRMHGGFGRARHTPEVLPRTVPCYLCMKCPPVCPSGALRPEVRELKDAGMGFAVILKDKCHNYTDGIMCWTCYDRCPLRGTAVILRDGFVPAITVHCVGCGVCEYVCPVAPEKAIVTLPPGSALPQGGVPLVSEKEALLVGKAAKGLEDGTESVEPGGGGA